MAASVFTRQWFVLPDRISALLAPEFVGQVRPSVLSSAGRRVRKLDLSIDQKRAVLRWGARYRPTWGDSREKFVAGDRVARDRYAFFLFSGAPSF